MESGWMIFSFNNEHDRDKVLMDGPYFLFGKPLLLKLIPDKFSLIRKDVATVPLWTRIFGIPNDFWTHDILGRVASKLGKPLYVDKVTESRKRGAYARVLIEVNFACEVLHDVTLQFDDGVVINCKVLYENEPDYCRR